MNYSHQEIIKKKEKLTGSSRKVKYRAKKYLGYISAMIGIALIFVFVIGLSKVVGGLVSQVPKIEELDLLSKGNASVMYDMAGNEIQRLSASDIDSEYIEIDKIPKCVQQAFIALEDRHFYEHHGVDMPGIIHTIYTEFAGETKGEPVTNTITLQLIQNQISSGGREDSSLIDKISDEISEQLLAIELENSIDKEQILEYYLNTINLGEGIIGVQAASKKYFDKDVTNITISEAAVLAAVVSDPAQYEPVKNQGKNIEKRRNVLKNMLEDQYITEEEYEDALGDDVYLRIQTANNSKINTKEKLNTYYADAVVDQVILDLKEKLGYTQTQAYNALYREGLQIYTCQDNTIQNICDDVINADTYYPTTVKSYLSYSLVIAKDGVSKEYSEIDVKNYVYETKDKSISLFFSKNKEAKQYVNEFKNHILKQGGVLISEDFQLVKQPQASFILIEQSTGRVKAIVGGRGQRIANRAINRATEDTRQPGSAFSVLSTYLPALDTTGMTLGTIQEDDKYVYPNTDIPIINWDSEGYEGATTLRESISKSINVSAVKTLEQVSARTGYEYLKKLRFSTIVERKENEDGEVESDIQLQMALGKLADGVTNLELTAAYAAIANKGVYQRPRFYTRIVDKKGNVLLSNETDSSRVMKESSSWLLTDAMQDTVTEGTAKNVRFTEIKVAQAGKTGTTAGNTDFWFEGFTPYYTAGIWTGQDEYTSQEYSEYHLLIWKEIMEQVHKQKRLLKGKFEQPDDIVSCEICIECGNLAVNGLCDKVQGKSYVQTEYYANGTQPTKNCDCHVKYAICKNSGKLAGENCPKEDIYYEVFHKDAKQEEVGKENIIINETCDIHNKQ